MTKSVVLTQLEVQLIENLRRTEAVQRTVMLELSGEYARLFPANTEGRSTCGLCQEGGVGDEDASRLVATFTKAPQ